MQYRLIYLLFVLTVSLATSCGSHVTDVFFPYEIDNSDKSYKLPKKLVEVSGLAYFDENKIFCVQDEDGLVFLYDFESEEVEDKFEFAKDNDYEGIALVDSTIYVLKSNGTLYLIENYDGGKKVKSKKITTILDSSCDAEGLTYDKENNQLLIACKGKAIDHKKNTKVVYSFNLETQKVAKEPYLTIKVSKVRKHKRVGNTQEAYEKFLSSIGNSNITFNPSAIAIHPITKNIYILSSVGKTLLVISNKGKIIYTVHLNQKKFKQPEGITFDENGTMYISNEGKDGRANIKTFSYKPRIEL